jgi:hypothetical protein
VETLQAPVQRFLCFLIRSQDAIRASQAKESSFAFQEFCCRISTGEPLFKSSCVKRESLSSKRQIVMNDSGLIGDLSFIWIGGDQFYKERSGFLQHGLILLGPSRFAQLNRFR